VTRSWRKNRPPPLGAGRVSFRSAAVLSAIALLRLTARAGLALTEDDRARIQACDDAATLDRCIENVLGAKTAADVLS
jgi:hypothetical protein